MELPKIFIKRMEEILGDETDAFLKSLDKAPIYKGMRINTLKDGAREAVLEEVSDAELIPWCSDGYYTDKSEIDGNHPYHKAGLLYFQEPSAMAVCEALDICEGDYVLDLCAAPGGKTTQAAAKLKGKGILVANEIVRKRAEILAENVERMGIKNTIVTNESPDRLADMYPEFFDKIIVDAPCSGEGMFRKEPQAVTEWSEEHTISCGERQKNILNSAYKMLRPGGKLVYSTCTFSPDENERLAEYGVLELGLELLEIPKLSMLSSGIKKVCNIKNIEYTKRIFPHLHKGEGHFIALFKKQGDVREREVKKAKAKDNTYFSEFQDSALNTKLSGNIIEFGENLYLIPDGINIDKVKVLRAGLFLGVLKKNRFEPSFALLSALKKSDFKNVIDCDYDTIHRYLMGDVLESDLKGWCALLYNGFPVGWGKASSGIVKNHYPKHLRLKK